MIPYLWLNWCLVSIKHEIFNWCTLCTKLSNAAVTCFVLTFFGKNLRVKTSVSTSPELSKDIYGLYQVWISACISPCVARHDIHLSQQTHLFQSSFPTSIKLSQREEYWSIYSWNWKDLFTLNAFLRKCLQVLEEKHFIELQEKQTSTAHFYNGQLYIKQCPIDWIFFST